MCLDSLQLNADKTEMIVFGLKTIKACVHLDSFSLKVTNQARNLGVISNKICPFLAEKHNRN